MLKPRIVGVVVAKNGIAVQSIGFSRYLPVGRICIAVEYLDRWGVDEIILLIIDATPLNKGIDVALVREVSNFCQVPLTVGGGVTTIHDIERLIQSGADRVAINNGAINRPGLLSEGAYLFGSQSIVASIDARRDPNGNYRVWRRSATTQTSWDPAKFARLAEESGAGEILLNSIDQDGSKNGFDLGLVRQVVKAVNIPVIACGGAGKPEHLLEPVQAGASAVAAANFFHYTEHSVIAVKSWFLEYSCSLRKIDKCIHNYIEKSVSCHWISIDVGN